MYYTCKGRQPQFQGTKILQNQIKERYYGTPNKDSAELQILVMEPFSFIMSWSIFP